ncbi:chain length-determining protein [uncultured Roseobacter sp.]|uniref:GumC family protein n=1 Tax=uncultured Roseobacter sp. TaxID=114847 RepID=UPI0026340CB7|nr:chain length-determining protein [uncultured Roseobacter sp.]
MNFDLSFYWKLFLNRLPIMLMFVLICSTLGLITAFKLPETYSTSASLLVEEPQIPDQMAISTVQTDATEQLDIIQQKLLTRANLIDIANRFRVFQNIGAMNPDTVFQEMRKSTSIRRSAGRNRATIMTIRFEGRSGRVVANVVNELVTLVLQENTTFRISRAENTLDFFQQEVRRLGNELDQQSADIAQFRSDSADALPDEQRYRLDRINLLQERLAQLERDLSAVELQRSEVERIYQETGNITGQNKDRQISTEERQLAEAKASLQQARAVYSESHPQVARLRNLIARLEDTVAEQVHKASPKAEDNDTPPLSVEDLLYQTTLSDIDARIAFITSEAERVQEEVGQLKDANARSAANGITLAALERDFANIQRRYNAALNNLNAAQVSERIESTAQGQRITVIESANIPQQPSGPNRPLIAAMGAAAGMALATGYFILLEILNRSIRRPAELRQKYNIVPIAVIPYMESRAQRSVRLVIRIAAVAIILIAVPLGLWYVDANYIPLEVVVQRGLARLGLG